MTQRSHSDPKVEALQASGTFNRQAAAVRDPLFGAHDFFDARDRVQAKYEMLRRVEIDGQAVAPTAAAFHVSRPSFYAAQQAFHDHGLAGLIPKKRGPRAGHKLTVTIVAFLQAARAEDPSVHATVLAEQVADRFGTMVHPRTIERALGRQEKKRQP